MSDKYTINNCELICNGECPNSKTGYCQDCTDCSLKQIVELCKEEFKGQYSDAWSLAQKISKLLDIQEIE